MATWEDVKPGPGKGVDLLQEEGGQPPIMPYLATILLGQAGINTGEESCVDEFRLTVGGVYIAADGQEYVLGARRLDQGEDKPAAVISLHDPGDIIAAAKRLNPHLTEPSCGMCGKSYSECACNG